MRSELEKDNAALLRLDSASGQLWMKLAQLQSEDGNPSAAKDSLLKATALDPKNSDAHRRLAAVYQQLHQAEAAQKELAAAGGLSHGNVSRPDPDSGLLVDARVLAATAFRTPPQQDDVALADIRILQLY